MRNVGRIKRIRSTYRRPISDRERAEDDKDSERFAKTAEFVEELVHSFINADGTESIKAALKRDQARRFEAYTNWKAQNRARRAMGLTPLPRPSGI